MSLHSKWLGIRTFVRHTMTQVAITSFVAAMSMALPGAAGATPLAPFIYHHNNVSLTVGTYSYKIAHPFVTVMQGNVLNEDEEIEEHVRAAFTATSNAWSYPHEIALIWTRLEPNPIVSNYHYWTSEPAFFDMKGTGFAFATVGAGTDNEAYLTDAAVPAVPADIWPTQPYFEPRFVATNKRNVVFQTTFSPPWGPVEWEVWYYKYAGGGSLSNLGPGQHPTIWEGLVAFEDSPVVVGNTNINVVDLVNSLGYVLDDPNGIADLVFPVLSSNVIAYEKSIGSSGEIAFRTSLDGWVDETVIAGPCSSHRRPRINRDGNLILFLGEIGCPASDGTTPLYVYNRATGNISLIADTFADETFLQIGGTGFIPNEFSMASYDIDRDVVAYSVYHRIDAPPYYGYESLSYCKVNRASLP